METPPPGTPPPEALDYRPQGVLHHQQFLICMALVREGSGELNQILTRLRDAGKHMSLKGGAGILLSEGPFRVVFRQADLPGDDVVFRYPSGISRHRVWRYFDQFKAEDLLRTTAFTSAA